MLSRWFRAVVLLLTTATLALAGAPAALAQPAPPPPVNDLSPPHPWTYQFMKAILALGLLTLAGAAAGYLVKARAFRANVRRGGSK